MATKNFAPRPTRNIINLPTEDGDTDRYDAWNPTPAEMQDFLKRDQRFFADNLREILHSAGRPLLVREIKESCLHSIDCIEQGLVSAIASGAVSENKGRYSLVKSVRK